jgi:hypothetical protein
MVDATASPQCFGQAHRFVAHARQHIVLQHDPLD